MAGNDVLMKKANYKQELIDKLQTTQDSVDKYFKNTVCLCVIIFSLILSSWNKKIETSSMTRFYSQEVMLEWNLRLEFHSKYLIL